MKVYACIEHYIDDYHVAGIFSTKAKARKYLVEKGYVQDKTYGNNYYENQSIDLEDVLAGSAAIQTYEVK